MHKRIAQALKQFKHRHIACVHSKTKAGCMSIVFWNKNVVKCNSQKLSIIFPASGSK